MLTRNSGVSHAASIPRGDLSETDRASLQTFVHRGRDNVRTLTRARILLKLAEGWTEAELSAAFDVCRNIRVRVWHGYLEGGLEAVLPTRCAMSSPKCSCLFSACLLARQGWEARQREKKWRDARKKEKKEPGSEGRSSKADRYPSQDAEGAMRLMLRGIPCRTSVLQRPLARSDPFTTCSLSILGVKGKDGRVRQLFV
jgi:hypothetical protein